MYQNKSTHEILNNIGNQLVVLFFFFLKMPDSKDTLEQFIKDSS